MLITWDEFKVGKLDVTNEYLKSLYHEYNDIMKSFKKEMKDLSCNTKVKDCDYLSCRRDLSDKYQQQMNNIISKFNTIQ